MTQDVWGSETDSAWGAISGLRPASFQHRLGALVLDSVLATITLGIGWIIWSLITWGKGQTPAKQILKIRVYAVNTRRPATWGHMAVRELLVWSLVAIVTFIFPPIWFAWIAAEIIWYFTIGNKQTLRDVWVKTLVVNEAA